MAYQRTEYHREVDREDDKKGGWRSWFGLDNKDDERDRGYNYATTTTYRNEDRPSYGYSGERTGYYGNVSSGYSGARGGYGYTTTDDVTRSPYTTGRDYGYPTTTPTYGPNGDRDVYYKHETRTCGDRDHWQPTGHSMMTPSRCNLMDREYPTRGYNTHTGDRDYAYTSRSTYPTTYPMTMDRDTTYPSRTHPTDREYPITGRNYPTDYTNTSSRTYRPTTERDVYPTRTGYGHPADREYTGRTYGFSGDRDTYPRGYGADRDTRYTSQHTSRY